MRGCARFLVSLEPWLRRLVGEAARWARAGTRTAPNGQLRIDRARRGSNGHPSLAYRGVGCRRRSEPRSSSVEAPRPVRRVRPEKKTPITPQTRDSYKYDVARDTLADTRNSRRVARGTAAIVLCMSRVDGSVRDSGLRGASLDGTPRPDEHTKHKPPTRAWRGGRRVQHTGMGRRHPVHRCSRHQLRTEITAKSRRRQRSTWRD